MRSISPYKFFSFMNGLLPTIIEDACNNPALSFTSTTAFLAPIAIFAEDDYYYNTMSSYCISNCIYSVMDAIDGVTSYYPDYHFKSAVLNLGKAVIIPLISLGLREMFTPFEVNNSIVNNDKNDVVNIKDFNEYDYTEYTPYINEIYNPYSYSTITTYDNLYYY